jgi:hypothetical protein
MVESQFQGAREFGGTMKLERKTRRLVLARTTLRLLSPHELKAVAGVNPVGPATIGSPDSYRECVEDPMLTLLHC